MKLTACDRQTYEQAMLRGYPTEAQFHGAGGVDLHYIGVELAQKGSLVKSVIVELGKIG